MKRSQDTAWTAVRLNNWHTGTLYGCFFVCIIDASTRNKPLTITLRPHQSRALDAMSAADHGQIIVPTGGGKTIIMIEHVCRLLNTAPRTIVVVAPRILLANQLSEEFLQFIPTTHTHVAHCHSGETHHFSTTRATNLLSSMTLRVVQVSPALSSQPITLCAVLLIVASMLMLSISTKHTTLALNISL